MTSNTGHFGSSGLYVSGGGYVRKTRFGAQSLGVSWNNLSTEDTYPLWELAEYGLFRFDNPMAHRNIALPWLANHTYFEDITPNAFGFANRTYTLSKFDHVSEPRTGLLGGFYIGYPPYYATEYDITGTTNVYSMVIPDGYVARAWVVGGATGTANIRLSGQIIPINTPTTYGTEYPTEFRDISVISGVLPTLTITGTGTLTIQSIQIRIVPEGAPVEPLTYSPGLGNSGMEFTEEGLQLVQHSAALDMQSATATWMETGWWK